MPLVLTKTKAIVIPRNTSKGRKLAKALTKLTFKATTKESRSTNSAVIKAETCKDVKVDMPVELALESPPAYEEAVDAESLALTAVKVVSLKLEELSVEVDIEVCSVHSADSADSVDSDESDDEEWHDAVDGEGDDIVDLIARFGLMETKEEQHLFNTNQLALGKKHSQDQSLLSTISVQAVEDDEDEDEDEDDEEQEELEVHEEAEASEVDENRYRAVKEALEARERQGERACSRLRRGAVAPGVITRPSVLNGLGRSSPLRNSWSAEDL